MKHLIAIGLAVAAGATAAQAQTVISRQITTEAVETVVTQGPNGTVITRRPLGSAPVAAAPTPLYPPLVTGPAASIYAPSTTIETIGAPASTTIETVETVEQPAAPVVRRQVVRQSATTTRTSRQARPQVRSSQSTRVVRQVTTAPAPRAIALTPQQRQVIYRSIVREAAPAPAPRIVTRQVVSPVVPQTVTSFAPMTSISDVSEPVVETVESYVGTALPGAIRLYDVPRTVAVTVPATRSYRYAYVDDRVLLVDPVTRVVVEDVTD